jgi:hypothetical protein
MKPIVLVGETRSRKNIATLEALGWGRMFVVAKPTPFEGEPWGFDNGAFGAFCHGKNFPEFEFIKRVEQAQSLEVPAPYLAVVPDIVAAGRKSLQFSVTWRNDLQQVAWPWYLAVQDGITVDDVRPLLDRFDGLFLGGTDRFKSTAYRWARLAHEAGLKFHYGRASTPGKLGSAFRSGADSCDSAFPLWTAERMKTFAARWEGLEEQTMMEYA